MVEQNFVGFRKYKKDYCCIYQLLFLSNVLALLNWNPFCCKNYVNFSLCGENVSFKTLHFVVSTIIVHAKNLQNPECKREIVLDKIYLCLKRLTKHNFPKISYYSFIESKYCNYEQNNNLINKILHLEQLEARGFSLLRVSGNHQ